MSQPKVAKVALAVPRDMTQGQIGSLIQAGIVRATKVAGKHGQLVPGGLKVTVVVEQEFLPK